jgi:cysteinyl-tRNA synthetase
MWTDLIFLRLETLIEHGYTTLDYRYFCLTAHYRTQLSFSWESLKANSIALGRLYQAAYDWGEPGAVSGDYLEKFTGYINDDLNMPRALAVAWDLVRSDIEDDVKKATLLRFDEVFGLDIAEWRPQIIEIPEQIIALATEREQARQDKNWQRADELRDEIEKSGYSVEDTSEGPKLSK